MHTVNNPKSIQPKVNAIFIRQKRKSAVHGLEKGIDNEGSKSNIFIFTMKTISAGWFV